HVEVEPSTKVSSTIETDEETTTTSSDQHLDHEKATTEDAAEHLSSEALTEAVREILGIPTAVGELQNDAVVEKRPEITADEANKESEQVSTSIFRQQTAAEEEQQPNIEAEVEERQLLSKTSSVDETVTETEVTEDDQREIEEQLRTEAEYLVSEILYEALREIIPDSFSTDLPSTDLSLEKTSEVTDEESLKASSELFPSSFEHMTTIEEEHTREKDVEHVEVEPSTKVSSTIETDEETTTTSSDQHLDHEKATTEDAAQHLSSEALTEAVRQILSTPLNVHLPSVEQSLSSISTEPAALEINEQIPATREDSTIIFTLEQKPSESEQHMGEVLKTSNEEPLSIDSLSETVRHILAAPLNVHLPSITSVTEKPAIEEVLETPSAKSHITTVEQIITTTTTTTEEEQAQPKDIEQNDMKPLSKTSSIVETTEERRASTEDKTKEMNAEYLSSEALTEAVREILATPLTVHLPSVDTKTEAVEVLDQPSTSISAECSRITETIEEQLPLPKEIHEEVILARPVESTVGVDESAEEVLRKAEDEAIPSDSLTGIVRNILSTPLTVHHPTVDVTTEKAAEEPSYSHYEQVTSIEDKPISGIDIQQDHVEQPRKPSLTTTTVQETVPEDKTQEIVAENLSTETLTEVIREILATPVAVHLPTVDHTIKTVAETEHQDEIPSTDLRMENVQQVESVISSPVTTSEEEILKSTEPSFTTDTTEKTTLEHYQPSLDETRNETEVESSTSDALTETVREILATPLSVHLPSVGSKIEKPTIQTEEESETLPLQTSTSIFEQITTTTTEEQQIPQRDIQHDTIEPSTKRPSITETVQETVTEAHQPSTDDKTKEIEADHLSSEALTEAVREILATPLTVHLPFVDNTITTTSKTQQQNEIPSVDSSTQIQEQISITMPESETTDMKDVQPESHKVTFDTETEQEKITEDLAKETEAERLSSEALTETVREILAAPLTVHLPSVDVKSETAESIEKPSQEQLPTSMMESTSKQDIVTDQVPVSQDTIEHETVLKTQEPILETTTTTTTTIREEETTSDRHLPSSVRKESREEVVSTDSLTETVRQILATPVPVHLPSVPTREVEQISETDKVEPRSKSSSITETVQERTSEDTTQEVEAEHLSSEALTEAVRLILATPLTIHLPSVDAKTETTKENEEPLTAVSIEDTQKIDSVSDEPVLEKSTIITHTVKETTTENEESNVEDKFIPTDVSQSSDSLVELTHEIITTSPVDDKSRTTIESEEVLPSSDSLAEIVHQVFASPAKSAHTKEVSKKERSNIQSQSSESIEEESSTSKSTSSDSDQIPLRSTSTDINEEQNEESFLQDSTSSSENKTVSDESQSSFRPLISSTSASVSEDESFNDDNNQSLSTSLYATIKSIVNGAIDDACNSLEQSISLQSDNQPVISVPIIYDSTIRDDSELTPTKDTTSELYNDYYSTSGLTNIVNSIVNLPNKASSELSAPHEDNEIILSSKPDFDDQLDITELSNIIDTATKLLNTPTSTPEQSEVSEPISPHRASAVHSSLITDDQDNINTDDHPPIFFVPQASTPTGKTFRDLYEHRYFAPETDEESSTEFAPLDREESVQSATPTTSEEKRIVPDLPLAYYELLEQRHTLMSPQQSTDNEKLETTTPSLTTWTTVQPMTGYEKIEKKQEISEINLDDNSYEYARRFDLESPSIISNLPTREYRQVFGIPDDIVNAVDDITYHIDQVLSKESDDKQQPITSDEAETLSFTSDEKSEIEEISPISDNVKRITEALDALESDIIQQEDITQYQQQSQTSKTVEGLIDELDVIESDLRSTTLNDDIRHTLEDHTTVFSSKDELVDEDLLPKPIEQEHFHDISKDETLSNTELDSRYSTLLDHIDSLEKTLLEFQPSPSSINETVTTTTTTDIKEDKEDATHTEQQISTLEDGKPAESDVNINDLAKTMEGILATPVRTIINPYEKIAHEEHITHSGLETALEQILATTHYPSKYTKLIPPIDTITSTDELKDQHEEIQTEQSKDTSTTHYPSKYTKLISPIDTITSTDELEDQHEEIQTEQSEDISTTADQKAISIGGINFVYFDG
ncbi:unnamed protein product, partial [Adineta steineri]